MPERAVCLTLRRAHGDRHVRWKLQVQDARLRTWHHVHLPLQDAVISLVSYLTPNCGSPSALMCSFIKTTLSNPPGLRLPAGYMVPQPAMRGVPPPFLHNLRSLTTIRLNQGDFLSERRFLPLPLLSSQEGGHPATDVGEGGWRLGDRVRLKEPRHRARQAYRLSDRV